jgi:hypothetical protein
LKSNPHSTRRRAALPTRMAWLAAAAITVCSAPALASDIYVGGALGQGRITASDPALGASQFKEDHTAFKIFGGVKAPLGLELEYVDFGKTDGTLGSATASGKLNGLGAFVVANLPVPMFDVFGKIGMARLDTRLTNQQIDLSTRGTELAWGLGTQFKAGAFAIRAEYERFKRDGRDPALLSLGFVVFLDR